ncbi:MAG TPA: flippase [Patescibacteria group bacterium]|nr:flippase [Patescibacteria group bacterium]
MASPSKNIFWLSVSRVFALVLVAIAYFALFRYLGPENSGKYQFVLSFSTLFGVVIDLGLAQYIIKKISEQPQKLTYYFKHFLAAEILLSICVYAALMFCSISFGFEPVILKSIAVFGVGMVLAGLQYPFLAVMSSHHDLRKVAFINFLSSLCNVATIAVTIVFGLGIVFLSINTTLAGVIALALYWYYTRPYLGSYSFFKLYSNFDLSEVKSIFLAAIPFALLTGFATIYNRIDIVLVSKLLGYTETGFYTAAYKFVDLMNFFPAVVSHVLYPLFSQQFAYSRISEARSIIERYLKVTMFAAVPIGVFGSLLAGKIILLIAGKEYAPGAEALTILAFAVTILIGYIVMNPIMISQLTRIAVVMTAVNVLVNVVGNWVLLPYIGIKGAAIMTVACELLQLIGYYYFVYTRVIKFSAVTNWMKVLVAGSGMGFVLYIIRDFSVSSYLSNSHYILSTIFDLVLLGTTSVLVYVGILTLLRYVSWEEIKQWKK